MAEAREREREKLRRRPRRKTVGLPSLLSPPPLLLGRGLGEEPSQRDVEEMDLPTFSERPAEGRQLEVGEKGREQGPVDTTTAKTEEPPPYIVSEASY